ncbi:PLP-dependent cysteine synthase family protein [Glaciecola siphonariae]|uniref:cysteine synthase n=1 Tax=Glaciecola siphonariae TaxID=521012 RepID=A0ABV9LX01_9ALTE
MNKPAIDIGLISQSTSFDALTADRTWVNQAVSLIQADSHRSADTHLIKLNLSAFPGIDFYLKDESTHVTGSLKHRLARSLFLYGICNGNIHEGTTIVEASSGSTAISEAYFARLLGLPFIAVVPEGTSSEKLNSIRHYGGTIAFAESSLLYEEAERLANVHNGHYMDQFTFAERVTDWRGNNNIAESLFEQMALETHPIPAWVVVGAGTGGTSATIGRFIRYKAQHYGSSRLCVADPEGSVFYDVFNAKQTGAEPASATKSNIEGVGRPRHEPSFNPHVVDLMFKVKDEASIATALWLESLLNRKFGGSTGLNVYAAIQLAQDMHSKGEQGSIVTLICDDGARYRDTVHNSAWRSDLGLNVEPIIEMLNTLR